MLTRVSAPQRCSGIVLRRLSIASRPALSTSISAGPAGLLPPLKRRQYRGHQIDRPFDLEDGRRERFAQPRCASPRPSSPAAEPSALPARRAGRVVSLATSSRKRSLRRLKKVSCGGAILALHPDLNTRNPRWDCSASRADLCGSLKAGRPVLRRQLADALVGANGVEDQRRWFDHVRRSPISLYSWLLRTTLPGKRRAAVDDHRRRVDHRFDQGPWPATSHSSQCNCGTSR